MAAACTQISFANWMIFGFPLAIIMMIVIWKLLGKLFKPEVKGIMGGMDTISNKIDSLGPMTKVEKISLTILLFTIFLWLPQLGLDLTVIP